MQSAEREAGWGLYCFVQNWPCSLNLLLGNTSLPFTTNPYEIRSSTSFNHTPAMPQKSNWYGKSPNPGAAPATFFNVLFLDIVDFHLVIVTAFGIVGGQGTGFFKDPVWQMVSPPLFTMTWGSGECLLAWNHQSFPVATLKVSSSF